MPVERVTFRNSGNLTLVGNFYSASSRSAIVMAHGFTSDRSSLGRFDRLAASFHSSGHNVLVFDFSGCGESEGMISSVNQQVDDLKSAISFVKSKGLSRIGLYGHSLGSLICLKCYSPGIATMVLSGALTDGVRYNWSELYSAEQLRELEEKGHLTTTDRTGKERKIGQQMLRDFEEVNQKELLKNVSCPVLIVHGNNPNDREEVMLLERSTRAMQLLPPDSRLEVIPGAGHSLGDYLDRAIELSTEWFSRYLPSQ